MVLSFTMQDSIYLVQQLEGRDDYKYKQPVVYEDNQGTIDLAKNPVSRQRCKHVVIKYHFIRSIVNEGRVTHLFCTAEEMVADILTNPLTDAELKEFLWYYVWCLQKCG